MTRKRNANEKVVNECQREGADKLSALHAETLQGIRRCNKREEPDPLVRGVSKEQAERILSYVRSLAPDPETLALALYNAIVQYTEAKHWLNVYRNENRTLRKLLAKAKAAAAKKGRKGSTPLALRTPVIDAMVEAMMAEAEKLEAERFEAMKADPKLADPKVIEAEVLEAIEAGRRADVPAWTPPWKTQFTQGIKPRLPSLVTDGRTAKNPSDNARRLWWKEAEKIFLAKWRQAKAEELERLAPLMDELCALEPPQPGESRTLNVSIESARRAARERARRRG